MHDPIVVGEILIPQPPNVRDEPSRSWIVLAQSECARFEQRYRQRRIGSAGSGEQDAEAAIRMTHEVCPIAHEIGYVLAVTNEVLPVGGGAASIAAPVKDEELKALIGKRPLCLPLLGSRRQRTVHQDDRRPCTP